jgi:simple sugar transport system substrate-binding protein
MCSLAVKVIEGEEIVDGIDLGVPGFENCTVDGKLVIGSAWVDVNIDNMEDYNF